MLVVSMPGAPSTLFLVTCCCEPSELLAQSSSRNPVDVLGISSRTGLTCRSVTKRNGCLESESVPAYCGSDPHASSNLQSLGRRDIRIDNKVFRANLRTKLEVNETGKNATAEKTQSGCGPLDLQLARPQLQPWNPNQLDPGSYNIYIYIYMCVCD